VKVGFLVDAGPAIGYGHLGRVVALCQSLAAAGAEIGVATQQGDFLDRFGFADAVSSHDDVIADADWVVIDHRAPTMLESVRDLARRTKLCLIDDDGDARSIATLLVDPPTRPEGGSGAGKRVLTGFDHVLLRSEFAQAHASPSRHGPVVVTLGGSDPAQLSARAASAAVRQQRGVILIQGPGFTVPAGDWEIVRDPRNVAEVLRGAALIICGFGHSLFEAGCLGVPAVFVSWWADQIAPAERFGEHGFARYAGHATGDRIAAQIGACAREILDNPRVWNTMSTRGSTVIDGGGAGRVARVMIDLVG
jgi:spore coat polysaccharide biosynthesis predicted glycosyltransferase SpsG